MKKIVISFLVVIMMLPLTISGRPNDEEEERFGGFGDNDKAGTYFIDLDDENQKGDKKQVKVHVKYPNTVLDYDHQEGIDAQDIIVQPNVYETLTKADKKEKAHAHAWSMEDGKERNITKVEDIKSDYFNGAISDVDFATEKDTNVRVSVFEQRLIHLPLGEIYMNQPPVLRDTIRTVALITIVLAIIPLVLAIIAFGYIKKESEIIEKVLYPRDK